MPYITDAAREYAKRQGEKRMADFLASIKSLSPYEQYIALVAEIEKDFNKTDGYPIYDKDGNPISIYDEYGEKIIDLIDVPMSTSNDYDFDKIVKDYYTRSSKILYGPVSGLIDEILESKGYSEEQFISNYFAKEVNINDVHGMIFKLLKDKDNTLSKIKKLIDEFHDRWADKMHLIVSNTQTAPGEADELFYINQDVLKNLMEYGFKAMSNAEINDIIDDILDS
jgi:hypothetical protein